MEIRAPSSETMASITSGADQYAAIADPLLQQSAALNASIVKALQQLRQLNHSLQSEIASKDVLISINNQEVADKQAIIETLETDLERFTKAEDALKNKKPRTAPLPPAPEEVVSVDVDGEEYVRKSDYLYLHTNFLESESTVDAQRARIAREDVRGDKRCNDYKARGTKNKELQLQNDELQSKSMELQQQNDALQSKIRELQFKYDTYVDQFGKSQKRQNLWGDALKTMVKRIKKHEGLYNKWDQQFGEWKEEVLKTGTVQPSDFDKLKQRNVWPDIERGLMSVLENIKQSQAPGYGGPGPAQAATPSATASTGNSTQPGEPVQVEAAPLPPQPHSPLLRRLATTQIYSDPIPPLCDPDETYVEFDDEDPDRYLSNFSPVSRAIMRRPGAETMAILHPEQHPMSSPISQRFPRIKAEPTSQEREGTLANPVTIKSEPNSEADWYGKYGWNRLAGSQEESIDLDNVPAVRKLAGRKRAASTDGEDGYRGPRALSRVTEELEGSIAVPIAADPGDASAEEGISNSPMVDFAEENEQADEQEGEVVDDYDMVPYTPRDPLREISEPNQQLQPVPGTSLSFNKTLFAKKMAAASKESRRFIEGIESFLEDGSHENTRGKSVTGKRKLNTLLSTPGQQKRLPPSTAPQLQKADFTGANPVPLSWTDRKVTSAQPFPRAKTADPKPTTTTNYMPSSSPPRRSDDELDVTPSCTSTTAPNQKRKRLRTDPASTPIPPPTTTSSTPPNPLSPRNYRLNPAKNDGLSFAFSEVVRDRSRKDCLPTCAKPCCKDLVSGRFEQMWQPPQRAQPPRFSAKSSQPNPEEDEIEEELEQRDSLYKGWKETVKVTEQNLKYGRHRAQHERAAEVKGFWDSDFPTTQTLEEQKVEADQRHREKGYMMHNQARKGGLFERRT